MAQGVPGRLKPREIKYRFLCLQNSILLLYVNVMVIRTDDV